MRRILATTIIAAASFSGFAGSAEAICAANVLCASQNTCYGAVNYCPGADSCVGGVNVCDNADWCSGLVNVCDFRTPVSI